ncbi:MAG: Methicillin resistance protein [Candidatus Syntrophoarchaeum butanivorans]|uniref:Methicillin resistance protein n=1 Tax=Candidatus Syntropharchaeum butanivorans TaxID=1839936 RepID=A0A1F2P404_9EURY|nr:MAG: Methicillin resistance protein [Candidatus Syntrophoarchaeum butanivorans]
MRVKENISKRSWREFVYNHPHGNIFQTPEMAEVYKRTKNYEPITLAALDDNNRIIAFLQAVLIKEGGILGPFSSRSIIQGGPLFVESEEGTKALEALVIQYDKIARRRGVIYTEIRNMWDASHMLNIFSNFGYTYRDHLNFLVDLTKSREELWNNLSKKRRNNIRRGKKRGVTIKEIKDRSSIFSFYNLIQETYRNAKLPLADISFFDSIFELLVPKNMAKFFLAMHENKSIGAILVLIYKGVIYDFFAGASRKYLFLCPNDVLAWYVIEYGSANGYYTFDFGGAGNPKKKYGVREFKKQFGGEMVNFGRYRKIHAPLKLWLAERGFEIYRKIRWKK